MIYLTFQIGNNFGWGICGKYLSIELAELSAITLITTPYMLGDTNSDYEYMVLKSISKNKDDFMSRLIGPLEGPVIQAIQGDNLRPIEPKIRGKTNIGYTFFESTSLSAQDVEKAKRDFDVVVAGSSWCEAILRKHGLNNTTSIIQGIDRGVFNPYENKKKFFKDKFVIFSGGKFELRKGQDLVIRAFKVLQDRHRDVLLVNSWFNQWNVSMKTMEASPYIECSIRQKDYFKTMTQILLENGIDLKRVIMLPPRPNRVMAEIYKNSDCGLFPNRCEGGTNLVLMEYMACGKPAIVSNASGHRDVVNEGNSIILRHLKPMKLQGEDSKTTTWDDPDLDEIVDRLEWAYNNKEALALVGEWAGESMKRFTWRRTAEKFFNLTQLP